MTDTPTNHTTDRSPCKWGGGNDYMACFVCGLEYDYGKVPMPPCGAPARIAELESTK
jgi:hypothetical protein